MKSYREMNYFEKLADRIVDEIIEAHRNAVEHETSSHIYLDDLFDWYLNGDSFSSIMDERNAPEEDYENDEKCREIFDEAIDYILNGEYRFNYCVTFWEDEIVVE